MTFGRFSDPLLRMKPTRLDRSFFHHLRLVDSINGTESFAKRIGVAGNERKSGRVCLKNLFIGMSVVMKII